MRLAVPPGGPYPLTMRIRPLITRLGWRGSALLVTALTLVAPAVAWAQTAAPPVPGLRRNPAQWIGYLVIFLFLALVLAVSIFPSKRGHQD